MKLRFVMDILKGSSSCPHTPALEAKNLPFYVENIGHYYTGKNYYTERQEGDNYLLFYTVSGKGLLRYRSQEYLLTPDTAALIDCNEYQFYTTLSEEPWEFRWIHFNGSACAGYFQWINDNSFSLVSCTTPAPYNAALDAIEQTIQTHSILADIEVPLLISGLLTQMLRDLRAPAVARLHTPDSNLVEKTIDFLEHHYKNKITLDMLASNVHLSKYHYIRQFRKLAGSSPYEYLIQFRIHQSKQLLKKPDLTVSEIAYQVGYNNPSNYIADFRKFTGLTPGNYRMQKKWL